MSLTWLIERGVYKDYESELYAETRRQSIECHFVDYRPGKSPPNDIAGFNGLGSDIVFIGSHPMTHQIQRHRNWNPGGWCNFDNLKCSTYYKHFGPFMLNSPFRTLTGVDALQRQADLFDEFGVDDEIFVRPNGVEKLFPGAVVHVDNFPQAISSTRFDPATQIVVASPVEIEREWRAVIAGDSAIAVSQYRDSGAIAMMPGCPAIVNEFCQQVLSDVQWRPAPIFVMDVCESNDGLHVLELNSFSCSGLYRCDLATIVRVATRMANGNPAPKNAG